MLEELKPIMQNGERYIVVEGGRPEYVVMRFADYVSLAGGRHSSVRGQDRERGGNVAEVNAELEELGAKNPELPIKLAGAPSPLPIGADPSLVHLEDLPL